jgi:hypothetical protein
MQDSGDPGCVGFRVTLLRLRICVVITDVADSVVASSLPLVMTNASTFHQG